MIGIETRIEQAKTDHDELEHLLADYLPFIKKQLIGAQSLCVEYDDMLSLAMLTFVNCVQQFTPEKGNFLAFCATCIRNRLIDESRRLHKYTNGIVPLYQEAEGRPEVLAAMDAYSREREQQALCEEIDSLSCILATFDISFSQLPKICPKQERSRRQCLVLAKAVAAQDEFRESLLRQHRLSQTELAREYGISPKTIEKHRKYIVTLAILLLGDYPAIRAFLPQYEEVR